VPPLLFRWRGALFVEELKEIIDLIEKEKK